MLELEDQRLLETNEYQRSEEMWKEEVRESKSESLMSRRTTRKTKTTEEISDFQVSNLPRTLLE